MTVVPEARMQRPAVFDPEAAWQQVLAREAGADGQFVYGVQSTGIYCRPGCPSRRPVRNNVRFFATCEEAEAAGFRACLRCEPARRSARSDPHAEPIRRAADILREQATEPISLDALAQSVGLSRFALLRGFRRVLGVTPSEFARAQRRERFRNEVRNSSASVTDAVYAAGFGSSSRLYENAANALGMRPSSMKAHGAGETIRWSTAGSPLGRMLVAATDRGVCAVLFADSDKEAERELESRFGKATLQRDDIRTRRSCSHGVVADDGEPGRCFPALRCARDLISASGMGGAAIDSSRRDAHLLTDCPDNRRTEGSARGGRCVWSESAGDRSALPPRRWIRWPADRLPLGARAQTAAAGNRAR